MRWLWCPLVALACAGEPAELDAGPVFGGVPECGHRFPPDFSFEVRFADGYPVAKPGGGWYVPMFQDEMVLDLAPDGTELGRFDLSASNVTSISFAAVDYVDGDLFFLNSWMAEDGAAGVDVHLLTPGNPTPVPRARISLPGRYQLMGAPAIFGTADGLAVVVAGSRRSAESRYSGQLWYTPLTEGPDAITTPELLFEEWAILEPGVATNAAGTALRGINSPLAVLDPDGAILAMADAPLGTVPVGVRDAHTWFSLNSRRASDGGVGALWTESFDGELSTVAIGSPLWSCEGDEFEECGDARVIDGAVAGIVNAGALVLWQRVLAPYDEYRAEAALTRVDAAGDPVGCSLHFDGGYAFPYSVGWDGMTASLVWADGWPMGVLTYHFWSGELPDE